MSTCRTCGGRDGAHYLCCVVGRLAGLVVAPVLTRLLGSDYPWRAPERPAIEPMAAPAEALFTLAQVKGIATAAAVGASQAVERVRTVIERNGTLGEAQRAARKAGGRLKVDVDTDDSYPDHGPADDAAAAAGRPSRTVGDWDEGESPRMTKAFEAFTPDQPDAGPAESRREEIRRWLLDHLTERGGAAYAGDVVAAARERGYGRSLLHLVRDQTEGITLHGTHTYPRRTYWALDGAPAPAPKTPDEPLPPPPPRPKTPAAAQQQGPRSTELAERDAALDLFIETALVPADDTAHLSSPELLAAYEAWRPTVDAPPAGNPRAMGMAMTRAGYGAKRRQARPGDVAPDGEQYGGRPKPNLYLGVTLAPAEQAAEQATEQAAEPAPAVVPPTPRSNTDDVAELRGLMARAKATRPLRVVRPGYDGDYPGREMSEEYQAMVAKLIDQGWTYQKTNANGKGKPRVINPRGHTYFLTNTPSDHRGGLNARAHLRRMGAAL